jgi:hypothetical protein
MPQWGDCDPIEVSIVFGECGPSRVPSETRISAVPAENTTSVAGPNLPPDVWVESLAAIFSQVSSTVYPFEAYDDMQVTGAALEGELYSLISSTPYPTEMYDDFSGGGQLLDTVIQNSILEELTGRGMFLSGVTDQVVVTYPDWPFERFDARGEFITAVITIDAGYVTYETEPEPFAADGELLSVEVTEFPELTVAYINWLAEGMDNGGQFISGELSS